MNNYENVRNIEMFLNQISSIDEKSKGSVFYRGQSNELYNLKPSLFRGKYLQDEHNIYAEFMTECGHEFEDCILHNEKLQKMHHYGVPTRLIDITSNALVALYFACENNRGINGAVYVLNAELSKIKQYNSDTVSILSALPKFTYNEKRVIRELAKETLRFSGTDIELENRIKAFNNENKIVKRLVHEIKKEKPAFENLINPKDLLSNYIFIPNKNNSRLIKQSGAFIIFGLNENESKNEVYNNFKYKKIIIDGDCKEIILKQLASCGITKASIYPELYKVAEFIKEKYK